MRISSLPVDVRRSKTSLLRSPQGAKKLRLSTSSLYLNTYIHTYIRLLTTSPKGLFSANYKEKDKNKNIYKLFKVTIANH